MRGVVIDTAIVVNNLLTVAAHAAGSPRLGAAATGAPLDRMRSVIETVPKRLSDSVLRRGGPTTRFSPDSRKLSNEVKGDIETIVAKALKKVPAGDFLEVHCTDPLSVIDIPNLIRETGDKVAITERAERRIVFLIEKTNRPMPSAN